MHVMDYFDELARVSSCRFDAVSEGRESDGSACRYVRS
jgi:hypothetical protein